MKTYEKLFLKATKPLSGIYNYNDVFQIYPMDLYDSAQPKYKSEYNFILEIGIERSEPYYRHSNIFTSTIIGKKTIEIVHLLSLASQFFIFDPSGPDTDELNGYTKTTYQEMKKNKINYYQNRRLNDFSVEELVLPEGIDKILHNYFELNEENRDIFRNALFLFYSGVQIEPINCSLAYVSLISSIETLIGNSFKNTSEKCKECRQDKYKINQKFKWFINTFAGLDDNRYLNKLYKFRSSIVHAGFVLVSDKTWHENHQEMLGGDSDDYFLRKNLISITRVCLLNWLSYVIAHDNCRYMDSLFDGEV